MKLMAPVIFISGDRNIRKKPSAYFQKLEVIGISRPPFSKTSYQSPLSIGPYIIPPLKWLNDSIWKQETKFKMDLLYYVAGDGDYVKGVVCLAKGLKKVKAAYPLVVAVLPDVPEDHRNMLLNQGCIIREIRPVHPPVSNKGSSFARDYFAVNYSKLRLWKFTEYWKMIYLDADIQVLGNMDNLFSMPSGIFYAVMDCLCEMDGVLCPHVVQWPQELGERPLAYLNCGMFIFEPSRHTYVRLLRTLKVTPATPFAEQDFLNMFFKDISKPLHHIYNLLLPMLWRHPEEVELDKVKAVHFCLPGSKPWDYTGEEEYMDRKDVKMLVARWWAMYCGAPVDLPCNRASQFYNGASRWGWVFNGASSWGFSWGFFTGASSRGSG